MTADFPGRIGFTDANSSPEPALDHCDAGATDLRSIFTSHPDMRRRLVHAEPIH